MTSNSNTNACSVLGKRTLNEVVECSSGAQPAAKKQKQSERRDVHTLSYTSALQSVQRGILSDALKKHFRTDVTFKIGKEGSNCKEFEVNRWCLATVSTVFDRMLFGTMKESEANSQVIIADMNPKTFECIVNFAYGQDPKIDTQNVLSLMKVCDMYQISSLYKICLDFFRVSLQTEFCGFFYEAIEMNIMHLVQKTLHSALSVHYREFLNPRNFMQFFCLVQERDQSLQFDEFVDICYKFLEHQVHANDFGDNDFSEIFFSFCLQSMNDSAFDPKLAGISEQYFRRKFEKCLNAENFCNFYIKATQQALSTFQDDCELFLSQCDETMTHSILTSTHFQEMNLENMKLLLALPWKCNEETLWERVVNWADYQSSKIADNHDNDDEQKQRAVHTKKRECRISFLKSVYQLIRFGLMDPQFFAEDVQSEKILTAEEVISVFTFFHSSPARKTPCGSFKTEARCSRKSTDDDTSCSTPETIELFVANPEGLSKMKTRLRMGLLQSFGTLIPVLLGKFQKQSVKLYFDGEEIPLDWTPQQLNDEYDLEAGDLIDAMYE